MGPYFLMRKEIQRSTSNSAIWAYAHLEGKRR